MSSRWIEICAITDGRAVLVDKSERPMGELLPSVEDAEAFVRWLGDGGDHSYAMTSRDRVKWHRDWRKERLWPECTSSSCVNRVQRGGLCSCCAFEASEAVAS